MDSAPGEVTRLLKEFRGGNKEAMPKLLILIYPELRRIADRCMRGERPDHTLQATALVNEAYLRLVGQPCEWKDRVHFLAVATQVMRQVLVDYARRHRAQKRGGGFRRIEVECIPDSIEDASERVLALDEALLRLQEWDPRRSQIVELRFFGGLTEEEIAEVIGVSPRTVKRDWSLAKAWLYSEIGK
jgi:RNA polymerase sigma-70 factor, ECF subfamily